MKTQFTENISDSLLKKISQKDWYRHGIYRDNVFCSSIISDGMGINFFKKEGLPKNFYYIKESNNAYITNDDLLALTEIFFEKIKNGGATFLREYILGHEKDVEELLNYSKKLKKLNYRDISNEEISIYLSNYFQKIINTAHWLWSMEFLNPALDRYLKLKLSDIYKGWIEDDVNNFLIEVSFLEKKLFFQKETEEILDYGKGVINDKQRMKTLFDKYAWLKMYTFNGNPFSFDEYFDRVKQIFENENSLREKSIENIQKAIRAKNKIDGIKDEHLKSILKITQELIYLKTYRIDIYTISWYNAWDLIKEVCLRIGIKYDDLLLYTPKELLDSLAGKEKINFSELQKRNRYVVMVWENATYHFYGKASKNIVGILEKHDYSKITNIKGLSAQKGVVRGIAKIALTDKDIYKINKGDILVANLTNPYYNPAFGKVAGVVTDEGGILCHSAIMAREFNLPCIIGTKIATQVLKDGDFVEVDADKGIVKILKRADDK